MKSPVWPLNADGSYVRGTVNHIKVECRDHSGSTPLILAALCGEHPCAHLNCNLCTVCVGHLTSQGHKEAVECLIVYGANVNARDNSGFDSFSHGYNFAHRCLVLFPIFHFYF